LDQVVEQRRDPDDHVLSIEVTESWAVTGVVAEYDNHYVGGELSRIDERRSAALPSPPPPRWPGRTATSSSGSTRTMTGGSRRTPAPIRADVPDLVEQIAVRCEAWLAAQGVDEDESDPEESPTKGTDCTPAPASPKIAATRSSASAGTLELCLSPATADILGAATGLVAREDAVGRAAQVAGAV
jgi:hypothetical protein